MRSWLPAAAVLLWTHQALSPVQAPLRSELRRLVTLEAPPQGLESLGPSAWTAVRDLYESRRHEPMWSGQRGVFVNSRLVLDEIERADSHGLDSGRYRALVAEVHRARTSAGADPQDEAFARLDVAVTAAAFTYAYELAHGRSDPSRFGSAYYRRARAFDVGALLDSIATSGAIDTLTMRAAPAHAEYAALQEALSRYERLIARGGWAPLDTGILVDTEALLEQLTADPAGARRTAGQPLSDEVARLAARLAQSGDLDDDVPVPGARPAARAFLERLNGAVRQFQTRHGLTVDGIVGPETLGAMNITAEERLATIRINLDRWRWVPDSRLGRRLHVNIPEFRLTAFDASDREALSMRVVVGTPDNATPVFNDSIEYFVLNPHWNIPWSIVSRETLPAAARDHDYLRRQRIEIVEGWDPDARRVDPAEVDWSDPLNWISSRGYRLRQLPGPGNSLGRIKFMFPNTFNVYIHDTPAKHLFEHVERDFSHGCIRAAEPFALAQFAVAGEPGWTMDRVRDLLEAGAPHTVHLSTPIPVRIVYITAWMNDDAQVEFRKDLYGWDARERGRAPN